jgi:hypothetical protein
MKKLIIILISFTMTFLFACGGKNMNGTADYSKSGPDYFNPDYHPDSDTNIVGTPKSYHEINNQNETSYPHPDEADNQTTGGQQNSGEEAQNSNSNGQNSAGASQGGTGTNR